MAPALICGNTLVVKPASAAPLSSWRIVEALHNAGAPKGEVTLVLAAADATGRSEPTDAALRELADALGSRRAASLAARLTGLPRNRLYAAITREKR